MQIHVLYGCQLRMTSMRRDVALGCGVLGCCGGRLGGHWSPGSRRRGCYFHGFRGRCVGSSIGLVGLAVPGPPAVALGLAVAAVIRHCLPRHTLADAGLSGVVAMALSAHVRTHATPRLVAPLLAPVALPDASPLLPCPGCCSLRRCRRRRALSRLAVFGWSPGGRWGRRRLRVKSCALRRRIGLGLPLGRLLGMRQLPGYGATWQVRQRFPVQLPRRPMDEALQGVSVLRWKHGVASSKSGLQMGIQMFEWHD